MDEKEDPRATNHKNSPSSHPLRRRRPVRVILPRVRPGVKPTTGSIPGSHYFVQRCNDFSPFDLSAAITPSAFSFRPLPDLLPTSSRPPLDHGCRLSSLSKGAGDGKKKSEKQRRGKIGEKGRKRERGGRGVSYRA